MLCCWTSELGGFFRSSECLSTNFNMMVYPIELWRQTSTMKTSKPKPASASSTLAVESVQTAPARTDKQENESFEQDESDDQSVDDHHDIQNHERVLKFDVSSSRVHGDRSEE